MRRDKQLELINRLLRYQNDGTTACAPTTWQNEMAAYADPARLAQERELFFRRQPLPFCLSGRLPENGSYIADHLDGLPVLVARGRDGVVRAFMNVCRHRGAPVAEGCGKARAFACPYHAWTYNLDGSVKGIPDSRSFDDLDRSSLGLTEIPATEVHGMIWVGPLDRQTAAPADPFGTLSDEIAEWNFGSYHYFDSVRMRHPMNWKLVIDTFLEGYHISALHKDTIAPLVQSNRSTFDAFGDHHRMVVPRTTFGELASQEDAERDLISHAAVIYGLFPTCIMAIQGAANVEVWRVWPDGNDPGRSVIELVSYIPEAPKNEKQERFWRKNFQLAIDTVEAEDFVLGKAIQANAQSGVQDRVVYGMNEPAMTHYHTRIRANLGLNTAL